MSLLFVHNQYSENNVEFYNTLAKNLFENENIISNFLFWKEEDIIYSKRLKIFKNNCFSFENYYKKISSDKNKSIVSFLKKYPNINWSQIVSSERAFTDYSMLLGSTGNRVENIDYIQRLIMNITEFISFHLKNKSGVICQTSDTLFSYITIKLANHYNIKTFIITPSLFYEGFEGAGFYANDENLKSNLMIKNYNNLKNHKFTKKDLFRINNMKKNIINFKNKNPLIEKGKGLNPGTNTITPKFKRILSYIIKNQKEDKNILYTKIDPIKKIKANLLRFYREKLARYLNLYGQKNINKIPKKNIFYAMHFQPEQSTLTQGNWYLNQIALIENISKSLPLNYTLVVKEHPWGRGIRPVWQYKYLSNFHNIIFCDATSKEIIKQTDAVLTISGSIIIESIVFDKPTIMFGNNFFEYSNLVNKVKNISDLPNLLFDILILKNILPKKQREKELNAFLLSYMDSLIGSFPIEGKVLPWADALIKEIKKGNK